MIISIVEKPFDAEALLNSLYEAEFNLDDVSVLMADISQRDKIAKDTGPLQGVALSALAVKLQELGLTEENIKLCTDAVGKGKILVAMNVDLQYSAAAAEIFQDHSASLVKES